MVDKKTHKKLRKQIRDSNDLLATLDEIAKDYQFCISCHWGDEFPIGDITIFSNGRIQCLLQIMGERRFKCVKKFSYAMKFRKPPHKYGDSLYGDNATGIHDAREW